MMDIHFGKAYHQLSQGKIDGKGEAKQSKEARLSFGQLWEIRAGAQNDICMRKRSVWSNTAPSAGANELLSYVHISFNREVTAVNNRAHHRMHSLRDAPASS